jgi:hypothetical protein
MNPVPVFADLNGVCHCGLEPQSMNPNSWMPGRARHDSNRRTDSNLPESLYA